MKNENKSSMHVDDSGGLFCTLGDLRAIVEIVQDGGMATGRDNTYDLLFSFETNGNGDEILIGRLE